MSVGVGVDEVEGVIVTILSLTGRFTDSIAAKFDEPFTDQSDLWSGTFTSATAWLLPFSTHSTTCEWFKLLLSLSRKVLKLEVEGRDGNQAKERKKG